MAECFELNLAKGGTHSRQFEMFREELGFLMRLEMTQIEMKDIQFGKKTEIKDNTLYVDKGEMVDYLKDTHAFRSIEVGMVKPGEKTRIIRIFDVLEPRTKIDHSGEDFPGIIGKLDTAGRGRTRALKGVSVVIIDRLLEGFGTVIDMVGPGADYGLYGKNLNITIDAHPSETITKGDYYGALRRVGLKAAIYLAKAKVEANNGDVLILKLDHDIHLNGLRLPRIGYLFQIFSQQYKVFDNEAILYGQSTAGMLPTILHPNEIIDGALVKSYAESGFDTYNIQNHPIIMDLFRRNQQELIFCGVVVTNGSIKESEIERNAIIAQNLFSSVLRVNGVIMTKIFGGASNIDLAKIAEKLEKVGIKAVPIIQVVAWESNLKDTLLFNTSSLDAVVCSGWIHEPTFLPKMDKIVGGSPNLETTKGPISGEIQIERRYIRGAVNNLGCATTKVIQY